VAEAESDIGARIREQWKHQRRQIPASTVQQVGGHPEGSAHYIVSLDARVTAASELMVILLLLIRYSKHSTVIIVIPHSLIILHVRDGGLFLCSSTTVLGCMGARTPHATINYNMSNVLPFCPTIFWDISQMTLD